MHNTDFIPKYFHFQFYSSKIRALHFIFHFNKHIFIPLVCQVLYFGKYEEKDMVSFPIYSWSRGCNRRWQERTSHFRNQWNKMYWNGWIWFRWPLYLLLWERSLRRNGVALIGQKKRVRNAAFGYNPQNDRMILVHIQGKLFNITVIQIYAPTTNAEETEVEQFYEDLQHLLELTPEKDVLFIIGN